MPHRRTAFSAAAGGGGLLAALAFAALQPPTATHAEELTGRQILDLSDQANQSTTQVTELSMLLIDRKGKEQQRAIKIWAVQGQGDDETHRTLTRFTAPKNIAGVGFLVVGEGVDAKRWLYLPRSKKTRMIAEGDKNKSFMGTDFTYYDLSPHNMDTGKFDPVEEEEIEGTACYKVTGYPAPDEESLYSKLVQWVRKDNHVPIRIDFYDLSGELLKRSNVLDLEEIDGNWTPIRTQMYNVQTDHKTVMAIEKVEYDVEIPRRIFERSNLERGR